MKQLLLIRHAKSSWSVAGQDDFDRPLNDRGMKDAPVMANRLLEKNITIDAFISSTARRALMTANFFADAYHLKNGEMKLVQQLYHAMPPVFYKVIAAIPDQIKTAAIFSHNPGITSFVNELTTTQIDNMPTCGVFAVKAETDYWEEFIAAEKTFWFFDYPKS